jgi:hypothetical protein
MLLLAAAALAGALAFAAPPFPPPAPPAAPAPPARDDGVALASRAAAGEPGFEELRLAAAARAAPPRSDSEGWRGRARLAALVPRLSVEYRHDERTYRVTGLSGGAEVDYLRSTPGDTVAVRAAWDLERLVFGRAELDAVAAAERAEARRREAAERAAKVQLARLRLKLRLLAPAAAADPAARAEALLELDALTAELNGLTGADEGGR